MLDAFSLIMTRGESSAGEPEKIIDNLLEGTSRSFYLTLKVLPKKVRRQIGLVYLLARLADTIADSKVGENKVLMKLLAKYSHKLLYGESVDMPDFNELADIQEDKAEARLLNEAVIPVNYLEKSQHLTESDRKKIIEVLDIIISGQILDLERFNDSSGKKIIALKNEEQLDLYTYLVAGSVGEFWTHMSLEHLFKIEENKSEIMLDKAVKFGKALQLINILRDLPEDLQMGRCYIPKEALDKYNLKPKDLLNPENIGTFRPLFNLYLEKASMFLDEAVEWIEMLPKNQYRLRLSCMLPILIGQRTLVLLREDNILDSNNRIKVSRKEIKKIMRKSLWLSLTRTNPRKMP